MSPHRGTRKRVSPNQSPAGDWMVSPHKRILVSHHQKKVTILDLPEQVIHKIFIHCSLPQLSNISQVCKQLITFTMSFLNTTSSIPVLFPSMTVATDQHTMAKFFISGSEKEYSLNMNKMAIINFRQLGIMVKKMTCLFTTRERVMVSTQLMSRLSPCSSLSPSSQMMSLCGIFLHQMAKGRTSTPSTVEGLRVLWHLEGSG